MDVLLAHATEDPPKFADLGVAGVPKAVEDVVRWIMAKDPAARPQSARELSERFTAALGTAGPERWPTASPRGHTGTESEPIMLKATAVPVPPAEPVRVATALTFELEAYMPESIAIMKLRGFAHDASGQIVESVPGLVRMRVPGPKNASGALSWLGLTRRADGPLDLELHLKHKDGARNGHLALDVLFRPSHPTLMADDHWQNRCKHMFVELRAYLIG